jgi:hypothetical protein
LSASLAGAADRLARMARCFDLAIVGQGQSEMSTMEQIIGEAVLFDSGRPMIMVPLYPEGAVQNRQRHDLLDIIHCREARRLGRSTKKYLRTNMP